MLLCCCCCCWGQVLRTYYPASQRVLQSTIHAEFPRLLDWLRGRLGASPSADIQRRVGRMAPLDVLGRVFNRGPCDPTPRKRRVVAPDGGRMSQTHSFAESRSRKDAHFSFGRRTHFKAFIAVVTVFIFNA